MYVCHNPILFIWIEASQYINHSEQWPLPCIVPKVIKGIVNLMTKDNIELVAGKPHNGSVQYLNKNILLLFLAFSGWC